MGPVLVVAHRDVVGDGVPGHQVERASLWHPPAAPADDDTSSPS